MSKKIIKEIDKLFDEICGTAPNDPEFSKEEREEKLERMKLDVLYFLKEAYNITLPGHKADFLKRLEREIHYRSGYEDHICTCSCGTKYKLVTEPYRNRKRNDWHPDATVSYDAMNRYTVRNYDRWFCFKCGREINTVGRIIKIRNENFEFDNDNDAERFPTENLKIENLKIRRLIKSVGRRKNDYFG